MYLKTLNLGDIHPYERNPRINDKAVEPVMKSIQKDGYRARIIVDKDGVIIAGHTRYEAMKRLGWTEAEVWIADDMTPEQIADYRIRDNLTGDFAEWDFSELEAEIQELDLDFDMSEFEGFEGTEESWFDRSERDGVARQEGNDEYNEFLDKFEAKKTTDDCYTPDNIYDAVADWVENRYKINRSAFIRPFYPGGDYQNAKYPKGCAVVDNPPFSIMAEIIRFYQQKGIRFFLFAPSLACFNYIIHDGVTVVGEYSGITYENGANVKTSFLTNMEGHEIAAFSDVELFEAIEKANDENEAAMRVSLPKYEYPDEVITSAKMGWLCQYGQALTIRRDESKLIRALDAQKEQDKAIYGGGLLLSTQKTAERAAAECAAATKWQLSDREREIQRSLGK